MSIADEDHRRYSPRPLLYKSPSRRQHHQTSLDATAGAWRSTTDEQGQEQEQEQEREREPVPSTSPRAFAHHTSPPRPRPDRSLSVTTDFTQPVAGGTRRHPLAPDLYRPDVSPADPHDFYRPFQVHFAREPTTTTTIAAAALADRANIIAVAAAAAAGGPPDLMRAPRKTSTVTARANGAASGSRPSRAATSDRNDSGASRPPGGFGSSRSQKSSLKDLVNQFNQNRDESLPVPASPGPRAASAGVRSLNSGGRSSKAAGVASPRNGDPTPSGRKETDLAKDRRGPPSKRTAKTGPHSSANPARAVSAAASFTPARAGHAERARMTTSKNPWASQSMTTFHLAHHEAARQPLFGEVLDVGSSAGHAGFGIMTAPRRTSEDNARPSLAHRRARSHAEVSPSSPTAWYLGAIPSPAGFGAGDDESTGIRPPHRRAKSDFSGNPSVSEDAPGPEMGPRRPSAGTSTGNHSPGLDRVTSPPPQSRIPLSSRQRSIPSEGESPASPIKIGPKALVLDNDRGDTLRGYGTAYRSTSKLSDTASARSTTPLSSRSNRYDGRDGSQAGSSSSLKAYISAPLPKKSPPLRSSRPRLPVSSASTSASRAKMVGRSGGQQPPPGTVKPRRGENTAKPRQKTIQELGAVDFAARRERIQRALSMSVMEDEEEPEPGPEPEPEPERLGEEGQTVTGLDLSEGLSAESERRLNESLQPPQLVIGLEQEMQSSEEQEANGGYLMVDTKKDSESDRADQESIRIMLQSSPVPAGPLDDDGGGGGGGGSGGICEWESESKPVETSCKSETGSIAGSPDSPTRPPPSLEQGRAPESLSIHDTSIYIQERSHDLLRESNDGSSPAALQTPLTGNSTLDGSTYSAINRVFEHYHGGDLASPDSLKHFQQRLIESPELARLGGWDPKRVTQLYLQGLGRGVLPSPVQTPELPTSERKAEEEPPLPDSGYADADQSITDIDSDGSGVGPGDERPSDDVSEGGWSSARPSFDNTTDEERGNTQRASLQSGDEWVDATPPVADWIQPQDDESLNAEAEFVQGPTPPPKEPLPSPGLQPVADGSLQSPQNSLDQEGVTTPRLSVESHAYSPESRLAGGGLGLAIKVDEMQEVPVIRAPPRPDHAPPPPPTQEPEDEETNPAPRFVRRPQSPPSPSIYSRNPPSSIFPAHTTEESRTRVSIFRGSDISTHMPYIFTPTAPPTQSSSSSHSRDTHHLETSLPPAADTSGVPSIPPCGPRPASDQPRLTSRRNVIKELLDTEGTFYRDVNITVEIYKRSAHNFSIITADDVKVLFGNIEQVNTFAQNFYDILRQASSSVYVAPRARMTDKRASASTATSSTTEDRLSINGADLTDEDRDRRTFIGEAFGQNLSRMEKVYADYLKNHDAANKKLQELQPTKAVGAWLDQCYKMAQDLTNAWSLDSLLVKPVQRFLKYPLLLSELLKYTPENHPDYTALEFALREMKAASWRINELKKRADVVEKVVSRKRKESDVRSGLSKAFGRRTEKLRQQVGLSEMVEDHVFNVTAEKLGYHYIQLQFAMRDVEGYLTEAQTFMDRFHALVQSIESFIDVSQSNHPDLESKWRRFALATRELAAVALTEHKSAVEANVIEPMRTLIHMYEGPQRIMQKRNKRKMDYARLKAVRERGDKPDKRTIEQGEQYLVLNETLKDELPKLYSLSGKLAEACLGSYVALQLQWQTTWQVKFKSILEEHQLSQSLPQIVEQFSGDFGFTDHQVVHLGICNGSVYSETPNLFLSPQTTRDDQSSLKRPSIASSRSRAISLTSNSPPMISPSDFAFMPHGGLFSQSPTSESPLSRSRHGPAGHLPPIRGERSRTGSTMSNPGPRSPGEMIPPPARAMPMMASSSSSGNPTAADAHRPSTSTTRSLDVTSPPYLRSRTQSPVVTRPTSGSTYFTSALDMQQQQPLSPATRPFSGFFSSAMPMSDNNSPRASPFTSRPTSPFATAAGRDRPHVLFTVASRDEFNVDRSRTEAGYPYLTYVVGEIFDVVAEKGELWLAINQDDRTHQIGWIWCKHFAKLVDDSNQI